MEYQLNNPEFRALFEINRETILNLHLPHVDPLKEGTQIQTFYYIFLIKRLESSPYAFYSSISNLLLAEFILLLFLDRSISHQGKIDPRG